jgi:hypothetical protein
MNELNKSAGQVVRDTLSARYGNPVITDGDAESVAAAVIAHHEQGRARDGADCDIYEYKPIELQFQCHFSVYPKDMYSSLCYTTDKVRAAFIVDALNDFAKARKVTEWLRKLSEEGPPITPPPPGETPTPRIDALAAFTWGSESGCDRMEVVDATFARTLERELATARAECERMEDALGKLYWHITDGKLSKPYNFEAIEAEIDDAMTKLSEDHTREAVRELCGVLQTIEDSPAQRSLTAIREQARAALAKHAPKEETP